MQPHVRMYATATCPYCIRAEQLLQHKGVNGLAQIRALDAALISSTSALESNKLGYEVGVRINIDVLNAENQVYVAKRDLARARFDTLLSQLKLKAAVGSLSETDLEQINPLFEAP